MHPTTIELVGTLLFGIALIHTFSTRLFEHLAHVYPAHAGIYDLLGEVEVVFGFWAMALMLVMLVVNGREAATGYLDQQNFTEPMFVFAIMVISGSRPILQFAMFCVSAIARIIPLSRGPGFYLVTLAFVPLLGSFITEPAAMTLAALILKDCYYSKHISDRLKYVTLGALFVNVSIGGALTPYAAPPVLMVASKWNWGIWFMLTTFGWKAAIATTLNALAATLVFQRELSRLRDSGGMEYSALSVPVTLVHLMFLCGIVVFAHDPPVFMGLLLFFLGFAHAYERFQGRLILREGLMVAFFLAGLLVLGAQQRWWLQYLLAGLNTTALYFGATVLTAFTDNAALTYLGSLIEGVGADFRYALTAGALTGGGLTVMANAPNPAGFSILKGHFYDEAIHPIGLLLAALPPTVVAMLAFLLL
jgi:predicted cation transporter